MSLYIGSSSINLFFSSVSSKKFTMDVRTLLTCVLALLVNLYGLHGQESPNINLNSSITAGSNVTWLSLSGDFAFGFYRISGGLYLAGVWFDKIPEQTLVWTANRDSPAEAESTVQLTNDGWLLLNYRNGSVQQIYSGVAASSGLMQNDGNLVLVDADSVPVWRSFESPTDTILPGQDLTKSKMLYSNSKGTVDYSKGDFKLEMQDDGNLVLSAYRFMDPGYWDTSTTGDNLRLVFNHSGFMYLVNSSNVSIHSLTTGIPTPAKDYYHRATIDDHGNFQQFVHKKNGSNWTRVWRSSDEPCFAYSICGVYGMCSSSDNETVTCNCMPGYIPLDPDNVSKGCRPETLVNYCAEHSRNNFKVEVLEDVGVPPDVTADLALLEDLDVEGCKKAVMDDCYSLAATFVNSTCRKKRLPLWTARKSASTRGVKTLIKVPIKTSNPGIPEPTKKKKFNSRAFLEIGSIISAVFAFLFGVAAIYYNPAAQRFIKRKYSPTGNSIGINFREFTFQELQDATNGFSQALGRGSSGKVYKGILHLKDTRIEIAVKKLEKDIEKSREEFATELKIIGRTHHKNLVRLLGFCIEKNQHLLVYELMPNGTLSKFLFNKVESPGWLQRVDMALGIARGLLYLHDECNTQIIHCDIKPENVLLDRNYTAKISDFGLSKLLNRDQTRTDTNLRGTVGYIAPEWLRNVPVTTKVDVFSFGVMLLEIICGRRHIELNRVEEESEEDDLFLPDWIVSCMISRKLEMVVSHDPEALSDFNRFERMAMVGLWCIHADPSLRPSMKKVVQMLEGTLEVGIPPLLCNQM